MEQAFSRTKLLIGDDNLKKLENARVAIFGIGGVGGYVCEALVRSGISSFDLIDNDVISITNLNRQIIATRDTIGRKKVDVMKERILSINQNAKVNTFDTFYLEENKNQFDFTKYDYVIDAIDTISGKLSLIEECKKVNTPIISSMGAGNKLNPTLFEVSDIYQTSVCPLAKVMRKELKKRNIKDLKVVYSKEEPIELKEKIPTFEGSHKITPGSISFIPSVVGLIISSEVIKDLINKGEEHHD